MLHTTQNKVELYVLKSKLDENSIESIIKNEEPPLAGEIPPAVAWPELWVLDDSQFGEAKKIYEQEISRLQSHQAKWTCSQCGEHLEGQFDICWKCGASRS